MSGEDRSGWLSDPAEIYRRSFAQIAEECDFGHLPETERHIAARIIHACGLPELAPNIRISPGLQAAAEAALEAGCTIYVDTEMTKAGSCSRQRTSTFSGSRRRMMPAFVISVST